MRLLVTGAAGFIGARFVQMCRLRGVGEVTDIVEKEMYTFDDHGESLSLRPEGTAPTVRAALEHNLLYDGPKRLWYSGPLFRHERPQKGRYRQYHTFGAEALGYAGPDVDIEQKVDRLPGRGYLF